MTQQFVANRDLDEGAVVAWLLANSRMHNAHPFNLAAAQIITDLRCAISDGESKHAADTQRWNELLAQQRAESQCYAHDARCTHVEVAIEKKRADEATVYARQCLEALEKIAARGPYSANGGMACATCTAFWHPDPIVTKFQSEHHYFRCAYEIARDALAKNEPAVLTGACGGSFDLMCPRLECQRDRKCVQAQNNQGVSQEKP